MSAKRDKKVQSFVGHVVDDGSTDDVLDSLEPIKLPELAHLFRTRLTPELVREMAMKVAAGTPIPTAAAEMGIPKSTWQHWPKMAKDHQEEGRLPGFGEGESPYLVWAAYMQQAKATFEGSAIRGIRTHGANDWKALAWLLERRMPDRYYPKKQVAVTTPNGQTALLEAKALSTDEIRKLLQENVNGEPESEEP